jgi:eukaryotic-like serine/threonine-protein kinase
LALAVLLITGTLVFVLRNQGDTTAAATPAGATTHPPTSSPAPAATTTPSPETTTPSATVAPVIVVTTTNPSATTPSQPTDLAGQLVSTITNYYQMLPGNLTVAWNWMTPHYQQTTARSWNYYQTFWGQFSRVTATDVSATSASSVTAAITYYNKNGRVETEVTKFGLVQQDNMWKIDTSQVIG